MSYSNTEIRFAGTVSGDVTTAGANEVINMTDGASNPVTVGSLAIHAVDTLSLKINDEANVHAFTAGDKFSFDGVAVTKITVVESGVNIIYSGGYVA